MAGRSILRLFSLLVFLPNEVPALSFFHHVLKKRERGDLKNDLRVAEEPPVENSFPDATRAFYHTSAGISRKLRDLADRCDGLTVSSSSESGSGAGSKDVEIDILDFNRDPSSEKKNRFFLLFGEHARELISPESALHFLQTICGESELAKTLGEGKLDLRWNYCPRSSS